MLAYQNYICIYLTSLTLLLGVEYILDSLPDGYALFDRPRIANPDIVGF